MIDGLCGQSPTETTLLLAEKCYLTLRKGQAFSASKFLALSSYTDEERVDAEKAEIGLEEDFLAHLQRQLIDQEVPNRAFACVDHLISSLPHSS